MDYRKEFILDVAKNVIDPENPTVSWKKIEELYKYESTEGSKPGDRARKHYKWYKEIGSKIGEWAPGKKIEDGDIVQQTEALISNVKDYTKQVDKIKASKSQKKITPKRLIFDIETSPNIGFFWSAGYKLNIDYSNIIKERAIMCICFKWEGDKKVYSLEWDANQDDKDMLEKFIEIANEADELVGHNGDKFDLAWIRTRCLYHNIQMFPKYSTIDTLKISRSKFRFNSNKLDYIAKYLGIGAKIKTTFSLWRDIVLDKNSKAMKDMVKYCKGDVVILEKVWNRLKNHVESKVHYGSLYNNDRNSCPECGSINLKQVKIRTTASGLKKIQSQCSDCNKYSTK